MPGEPHQDQPSFTDLKDLMVHQDNVIQKWISFLVTIQSGLIVALGYLSLRKDETPGDMLSTIAPVGICMIGILVANNLLKTVYRERVWANMYMDAFLNAKDDGTVRTELKARKDEVLRIMPSGLLFVPQRRQFGTISQYFSVPGNAIIALWIVALAVVICERVLPLFTVNVAIIRFVMSAYFAVALVIAIMDLNAVGSVRSWWNRIAREGKQDDQN